MRIQQIDKHDCNIVKRKPWAIKKIVFFKEKPTFAFFMLDDFHLVNVFNNDCLKWIVSNSVKSFRIVPFPYLLVSLMFMSSWNLNHIAIFIFAFSSPGSQGELLKNEKSGYLPNERGQCLMLKPVINAPLTFATCPNSSRLLKLLVIKLESLHFIQSYHSTRHA